MPLYPTKFPFPLRRLFPNLIFEQPNNQNTIYLTFDDGPTPEVTAWVLNLLQKERVKANFFLIGNNIQKYPDIVKDIVSQGHQIANHTFNHNDAWQYSTKDYMQDVFKTEDLIDQLGASKKLFRPPYGRLTPSKIAELKKAGFKIVMWSIISGDFSKILNTAHAVNYLKSKAKPGYILVFHDSFKGSENLKAILPDTIRHLKQKGFKFGLLG
jgi:peptidoglycan/xylan/chitin deacetylase (PgdA/CDA1 family)